MDKLTWNSVLCGCEIDSAGMGIVWCPVHMAAPALLEALEQAVYAQSLIGVARASANDALYGPGGKARAAIAQGKGEA